MRVTLTTIAIVAGLVAMPLRASAQRLFEGGEPFETGALLSASDILTGDFDGDGRTDLATVHGENGVRIFLGGPDAVFEPPFALETNAPDCVAGDFNGDGLTDLAAFAVFLSGIFVNLGEGEFAPMVEIDSAIEFGNATALSADVDSDGLDDLLIHRDRRLSVHLGARDGSFPSRDALPLDFEIRGLAAADLDGDGAADLIAASPTAVRVYRGRGDGTFEPAIESVTHSSAALLETGDFFRDGLPEAVIIAEDGSVIFVAFGEDGGLEQSVVADLPDLETGLFSPGRFLQVADFDGDGAPDLILGGSETPGGVRVLLGFGDWIFPVEIDVELGLEFAHAEFGDFDEDGSLDAVIARSPARELVLFRGAGRGRFGAPASIALEVGVDDLASADLDRNGVRDIVVMSAAALHVVRGDLAGGHERPIEIDFPGRSFVSMAASDFDADGRTDFALIDQANDRVVLVALDSEGRITREEELGTLEFPGEVHAARLDGDRFTDLIVAYRNGDSITCHLGPWSPSSRRVDIDIGSGQTSMATADLDGDGNADIAASTRDGLLVLHGDGLGGFERGPSFEMLADSPVLRAADLDGDGSIDIAGARATRLVLAFAPAIDPEPRVASVETGHRVRDLRLVDRWGDGRPEAVVAGASVLMVTNELVSGNAEVTERYAVSSEPRSIVLDDLEGDGALDCVTAEWGARKLSVFRGRPPMFRRGDADADGKAALTDAIVVLGSLFLGQGPLDCPDAGDVNDSGGLELTDAVALLGHLFRAGPPPPPPGLERCGVDPTPDALPACRAPCR